MKIGDTELKYGLMLAPMAGFSDRAMRLVCHNAGAEYSVTEMVSAKAVVYGDKKTHALARIMADEGPCALQIFGNDPGIMAEAAGVLSHGESDGVAPTAIDINMGCPMQKVFGNGEGSALMRDPDLIYRICRATSAAIDIPLTVKMRAGINADSVSAVECSLAAEEGGASLVTVHGRTRVEMYSGQADMNIVKKVKNSLRIPVVANGDITCGVDALRVLSETGADGIMIGRGAIGNPFVFAEISAMLSGTDYTPPSLDGRVSVALLQLRIAIEEKGETVAVREARKQIALYLKGFRGAARARAEINRAESYSEVESALLGAVKENG